MGNQVDSSELPATVRLIQVTRLLRLLWLPHLMAVALYFRIPNGMAVAIVVVVVVVVALWAISKSV